MLLKQTNKIHVMSLMLCYDVSLYLLKIHRVFLLKIQWFPVNLTDLEVQLLRYNITVHYNLLERDPNPEDIEYYI